VARIYEEIKGRPLYILSDSANLDLDAQRVPRAAVLPKPSPRESWAKAGGL
jgi:hypothetical protein